MCVYTHTHTPGNAIKNADTPVMDALAQAGQAYTTLDASGLAVGLPEGLMGNSEVGHFTIGTGRVVYQVSKETQLHDVMQCWIDYLIGWLGLYFDGMLMMMIF